MWNLKNKTALITGGTKGIGRATVLEFLSLGAKVIFTARHEKEVNALTTELDNGENIIYGLVSDVAKEEDLQHLKEFVEKKFDKLDILVNNAGINIRKAAIEYQVDEYQKIMNINLTAPFLLSRHLHPLLKISGHASVINVASVAANQDVRSGAPYGMAKAGLLQLTRSLAVEWAPHKIRVNAVSPWYTQTPLTTSVFEDREKFEKIKSRTPMNRIAQAEEMASVITFLAMEKSSYITGQNMVVDGGMSISAL